MRIGYFHSSEAKTSWPTCCTVLSFPTHKVSRSSVNRIYWIKSSKSTATLSIQVGWCWPWILAATWRVENNKWMLRYRCQLINRSTLLRTGPHISLEDRDLPPTVVRWIRPMLSSSPVVPSAWRTFVQTQRPKFVYSRLWWRSNGPYIGETPCNH